MLLETSGADSGWRFPQLHKLADAIRAVPAETARLGLAFLASALLHVLVLLMPYLATRHPAGLSPSPERPVMEVSISDSPQKEEPAAPVPSAESGDSPTKEAGGSPAPTLDLLPIPAPPYYSTSQLTKRPQPLVLSDLETPSTREIAVSGRLVLKLWIDDRGMVTDVVVEKTDLPEVFAVAALAGFKSSRFIPGERDGRPVGTIMIVEISYDDSRLVAR